MKAVFEKIDYYIEPLRKLAEKIGQPLLLLAFRIHMATVFFASGWGRFKDYLNGSWDTQIFLFEMEHPVPGVPAGVAAPLTTFFELFLPLLLAFGLFGRFAAAGMLIMTLVIEFTYNHPEIAMDVCLTKTGVFSCIFRTDHIVWAAMLLAVLAWGPGRASVDHYIVNWLRRS